MNSLGVTNVEIKKYINKEDDDFKMILLVFSLLVI